MKVVALCRQCCVQYWALVDGLILGRQDAWRPGTILVVDVRMLVALCWQLLFSDCGHNSADSWVGARELTHVAQVAGCWALVRARTGESAKIVQTLAGSTETSCLSLVGRFV